MKIKKNNYLASSGLFYPFFGGLEFIACRVIHMNEKLMYFFPILGDSPRNGHSREGFNACDSVVSPGENDAEDIDEGTKNQRHRYSI